MGAGSVVSDHDSSRFPLSLTWGPAEAETGLARSFLLRPDGSACEPTTDVEHALPCGGMPADAWVDIFHQHHLASWRGKNLSGRPLQNDPQYIAPGQSHDLFGSRMNHLERKEECSRRVWKTFGSDGL